MPHTASGAKSPSENLLTFSWSAKHLDRRRFLLLSWLLHLRDKQQEPSKHSWSDREIESSGSDVSLDCEKETHRPCLTTHQARLSSLKRRLLNRLSEVMARVKRAKVPDYSKGAETSKRPAAPGTRESHSANHVAAAILCEGPEGATIYVAKNAGLDDADKKLMELLSVWIRIMATTGQRPAISTDKVWKELLVFYSIRLSLYMASFQAAFTPMRTGLDCDHSEVAHNLILLDEQCSDTLTLGLGTDEGKTMASEAVLLAYRLRQDHDFLKHTLTMAPSAPARSMWKSVCYLGRLVAAYETFKEAAMHFACFKKLTILPIETHPPKSLPFDLNMVTSTLSSLGFTASDFGVKAQNIREHCERETHTHAEIQLLLKVQEYAVHSEGTKTFPYVGTSKKACFLCANLLSRVSNLETRGSHGKVYPQWNIPDGVQLPPRFFVKLQAALLVLQKEMQTRVGLKRKSMQHVPESSVGISTMSSGSSIPVRLRRNAKIRQRITNAGFEVPSLAGSQLSLLGKQVLETRAVRLPFDGTPPHMITLGICETTQQYDSMDCWMSIVPQLRKFWDQCQYERCIQSFEAEKQEQEALNGAYRVYWNMNSALPENQSLKNVLLGPKCAVSQHKWFFCGDVFIIGFASDQRGCDLDSRGRAMYRDIDNAILESHIIRTIFTSMWEDDTLEEHLKLDQHMDQSRENHERAGALFRAQMPKEEQEILANDRGLLDYIMISEGETADGWIPTGMCDSEDLPGMVELHGIKKVSKLEQMGWQGFSSNVL